MLVTSLARQRGYTLAELLCIFAIASLLLAAGAPSFMRLVRQHRLATVVNEFHAALRLARSEALRRGVAVDVVAVDGDWRRGWMVLVDRNGNASPDADDDVIARHGPLPEDISISASLTDMGTAYIGYSAAGRSRSHAGASQSGSLSFSSGDARRRIVLNFLGRARSCNPDGQESDC
jgi:type IV fimbrial biogenesis protein FimT